MRLRTVMSHYEAVDESFVGVTLVQTSCSLVAFGRELPVLGSRDLVD